MPPLRSDLGHTEPARPRSPLNHTVMQAKLAPYGVTSSLMTRGMGEGGSARGRAGSDRAGRGEGGSARGGGWARQSRGGTKLGLIDQQGFGQKWARSAWNAVGSATKGGWKSGVLPSLGQDSWWPARNEAVPLPPADLRAPRARQPLPSGPPRLHPHSASALRGLRQPRTEPRTKR